MSISITRPSNLNNLTAIAPWNDPIEPIRWNNELERTQSIVEGKSSWLTCEGLRQAFKMDKCLGHDSPLSREVNFTDPKSTVAKIRTGCDLAFLILNR